MAFVQAFKGFLKWSWCIRICSFEDCTLSFSSKSFCLQITADVSKISKSVQADFTLILNVLSETCFCKTLFSSWNKKKRFYFHKNVFYWKRGCATMRNYVETSIMVCLRRYASYWARRFDLDSFQKTKWNEMKKMDKRKKSIQKN